MPVRRISTSELNRTLLVRQSLVKRSHSSPSQVLRRVAGLQTQYAPSGYVGLWSRSHLTDRTRLTRALERRSVVQATLLRATIHMVSSQDYPTWLAAIEGSRRDWWRRVAGGGIDAAVVEKAAELVAEELADGPVRRTDLQATLANRGFGKDVWSGVELWLGMVRVPPSGTWERRRADLYGRADLWLDVPPVSERAARAALVDRYFRAYGPTTVESIATWTGIPKMAVAEIVEPWTLRRFVGAEGDELVDLPRLPIADGGLAVPVRFLPTYDDILLVHVRRAGVLAEDHRSSIFNTKMPQSVGTFLIDGVVAGVWKPVGNAIVVEPFGPIPRRWRRELDEERLALAAFHR